MINPASETLIPISQASDFIPGSPHRSTVDRWRRHGVKGVKLSTLLVGGRRFTSREALVLFVEALSSDSANDASRQKSVRKRTLERNAATARLRARGVLK